MGRPTAVPPTFGRFARQSLVIPCLLLPCARILSRGKSLFGHGRPALQSSLHRLTGWKARPTVIYRLPSIPLSVVGVCRLSRGLPSAVRGLHSLIRSLFVDGPPPPTGWKARVTDSHGLPSTVYRLTGWKARPTVIYRLPSIPLSVVSIRRLSRGLPSAVRSLHSLIRSLFVDGPPPPTGSKARPTAVRRPSSLLRGLCGERKFPFAVNSGI